MHLKLLLFKGVDSIKKLIKRELVGKKYESMYEILYEINLCHLIHSRLVDWLP